MAKRVISFADYQEPTWEEYTGEDPKPNQWFTAELKRAKYLPEDDQVQMVFEITEGDFKGWGRGIYCPLEPSSNVFWKTQETIRALQGGVTKDLAIDWENEKQVEAWVKKQHPVRLKTREYNDKITIGKVSALLEVAGGTTAKSTSTKLEDAPAVEADDDAAEEDYTAEELNEMSVADLEEVLTEEFEFEDDDMPKKPRRGGEAAYKKLLVAAILDEQEGEDEDGDDQDADDADGDDGDEFEDGFDDDAEPEPEPAPEPAPRARRGRTAAKATPAPEPAPAATTRRRRR